MNASAFLLLFFGTGFARAVEFYVAPMGADTAPGSKAQPFATLNRARDAVRERGDKLDGATVWIESGVYPVTKTFELTAADSGNSTAPIVWRAPKDGTATLDAGRQIAASDFVKVDDPTMLARMAEQARGKVWVLDLARLGVRHAQRPPDLFEDGGGLLKLYCDGARQPLSRWPNDANTAIARVLDAGDSSKGKRTEGATFAYREDRPARWAEAAKADQLWLAGYWRVPWEFRVARVKRLDPEQRTITLAKAFFMGIGSKYAGPEGAGTEPWRAVNLLEEIDRPGEWSVDFAKQTLYWWPPVDLSKAEVVLADFAEPMVRLNGVAHVTLRGFVFQHGLGNGVEINGGESCAIAACTLRNLGGNGVIVNGGKAHQVLSCDLHTLGHAGILMGGGDRATLTPAGHVAENNHIHNYGLTKKVYAPGIGIGFRNQPAPAVGCIARHNRIHNAPHGAVLYGGNDHLFELNEIYDWLKESDDLGAFYATYDWTSYGNVVRHNFFHHAPHAIGVYLDDGDSGDLVEGNIGYRLLACVASGGGHDNVLRNNIGIECRRAAFADARGIPRKYGEDKKLLAPMAALKLHAPPWSERFPTLAGMLTHAQPGLPHGTLLERNVAVACETPLHLHGNAKHLTAIVHRDNVALLWEDLGFADLAKLDLRMRADAPVFQKVPGFQPIPFEKIGLIVNDLRPALPLREPQFSTLTAPPPP